MLNFHLYYNQHYVIKYVILVLYYTHYVRYTHIAMRMCLLLV